ncbi:MAG: hypothetical protein HYS86_02675 [Candidatus Chisholmbacteria bacterium]|nr:hypothetical protein [Candidatus Chisholmbacteria bacterium]
MIKANLELRRLDQIPDSFAIPMIQLALQDLHEEGQAEAAQAVKAAVAIVGLTIPDDPISREYVAKMQIQFFESRGMHDQAEAARKTFLEKGYNV